VAFGRSFSEELLVCGHVRGGSLTTIVHGVRKASSDIPLDSIG
jgi:hypothetical protein